MDMEVSLGFSVLDSRLVVFMYKKKGRTKTKAYLYLQQSKVQMFFEFFCSVH